VTRGIADQTPVVHRHRLGHPPHEALHCDAKTKADQHVRELMGQQDDARGDKQGAARPNQISGLGRH
jgi:hypothetical protein